MDNEQLTEYYWKTLKEVEETENDISVKTGGSMSENNIMHGILFSDLIRLGVPFTIETTVVEKKKESSFLGISVVQDTPAESVPQNVVIKDDYGNIHKIACKILQSVMQKDYDKIILGIDGTTNSGNNVTMDISVPKLDDEQEDKPKNKKKQKEEKPVVIEDETPANSSENRLPEFVENTGLPKDAEGEKAESTFLYNVHTLTIDLGTRGTGVIKFYVYPLQYAKNSKISDIMVVAEAGGIVRAALSKGVSSSVRLLFEDFQFVIRGRWQDGSFISQVNPLNDEIIDNTKSEVKSVIPEKATSTMYMHQQFGGADLYIFPAKYGDNADTGYALTAMAIATKDDVSVVTPTANGNYVLQGKDNKDYSIELYWISSPAKLRCQIEENW